MERIKLKLKFSFQSTKKDVFLAITKPQYLQNWIAEEVDFDSVTGVYTFHWRDYSESAKIVQIDDNAFVKWSWIGGDHDESEYVSFRIQEEKGDEYIDLYVEDFCDKAEERDLRDGWDKQMNRLERNLK